YTAIHLAVFVRQPTGRRLQDGAKCLDLGCDIAKSLPLSFTFDWDAFIYRQCARAQGKSAREREFSVTYYARTDTHTHRECRRAKGANCTIVRISRRLYAPL